MIQVTINRAIPSRNELEYSIPEKKRRVKTWWQLTTEEQLLGKIIKFDSVVVAIHIYFKTSRFRDYDNYMASIAVKGIIDGIVKAGVVLDDNEELLNYHLEFHVDKENPRTEVLIYGSKEGNDYYQ